MISERFDSEEVIPYITCPTVIFHGDIDEVCPVECGEKLIEVSGAEVKVLKRFPLMTHDNVFLQNDEHHFMRDIVETLKEILPFRKEGPVVKLWVEDDFQPDVDLDCSDAFWEQLKQEEVDISQIRSQP